MPELLLIDSPVPVPLVNAGLPDAHQRAQALDIRRSWIVEAPAGSGKTGLLIQRFLKLLADGSVATPEQVLAITFTKKATAEMRERVLSQLQSAASGDPPGSAFERETRPFALAALSRDREFGWSLLEQPHRLNIRTIDSVCSEIASSLPILSGSAGRSSVIDDATPLYAAAARRTFLQLGGPDAPLNHALRDILLHRDGNLAECEGLLAGMLRLRDQWGELVPLGRRQLDDAYLDATVLPRLERALEQAICTALTQLARTIPSSILSELTLAAAGMAHLGGYKGAASPIAICANKTLPPGERAEDLAHWQALIHLLLTPSTRSWRRRFSANFVKFDLSRDEQVQLRSLVEQLQHRDDLLIAISRLGSLPPARYPQEQWIVAKALFCILNHAMAELQIVFAERSECDYTEIALAAKTALRVDDGPHDLEAALGLRLQHILVDETQDTSSSQYELIQILTAHFDGHSQTAFLVGDPKQSIYLFRQARVERFLHAMSSQRLGDVPMGLLRLTSNFRSQANLVADFNHDFAPIFSTVRNAQHPEDVQFVAASAMRSASSDAEARVWHPAILPYVPPGEKSQDRKLQQQASAREVRETIEYWRSKPLPEGRISPWKIAVLVRSRNHLEPIVEVLRGDAYTPAIPFRAVEIEHLHDRPEVLDLFALTRALMHPADRAAWLAILHAPWCGLGLAELHVLTGSDDPSFAERTIQSLIAERGELLPPASIQRLERIWPTLEAALALRSRAPLAQIVERTWRSLGGDAYATPSDLENAHSYLRLLEEIEAQPGGVDLSTLKSRLDRLFASSIVDPGAVELITIHKAKGLEWDVVIVPSLELRAGANRSQLLSWIELDGGDADAAHFLLAPIAGKGEDSHQLNKWIASLHTAREAAERKRLFYVACTRAREELHLFAAPALSQNREIKPRPGSLLEAAWPAAEAAFAGPLASARASADVLPFPAPAEDDTALSIAAAEAIATPSRPAILKRLPIAFDPLDRLAHSHPLPYGDRAESASTPFERPEGSIAARGFGNAVHAFLERIAQQIAAGQAPRDILAGLPGWTPRIIAMLRAQSLPPTMVERLAHGVLHALEATLKDPVGLWLLSPLQEAATEFALTAWSGQSSEPRKDIRVDRTFRAGPEPLSAGSSHLWIVDYKTSTHGPDGLEAFLSQERAQYAPQLEAYAAVLHHAAGKPAVRLALYYPLLSRLIHWPFGINS